MVGVQVLTTSRFAPTKHRARMMASVFFMQPLGQISGNVISLIVVAVSRSQGDTDLTRSIDILWRWVIGLGAVPGVIALAFRLAIPETPRFLLDIEDDPIKAEFDTTQLFGESVELQDSPTSWHGSTSGESHLSRSLDEGSLSTRIGIASSSPADWSITGAPITTLNSKWTLSRADIRQYFLTEGNWRTLAATSFCWLLLDFGFYGIGLSSPQFLAKTWGDLNIKKGSPMWMTNDDPNTNIYDMFMRTSVQALIILNIGSFAGGLTLILLANKLNRVSLQKYGFLFLAALFIALGTCFITLQETGAYAVALYVVGQFAFNFGPNSTTYILPAELFPTRYRASCHGLSAGMGKLGSILVQVFSAYYKFGSSTPGAAGTKRYGKILIVFSIVMLTGAAVTHFFIPDVQYRDLDARGKYRGKLRNRTLESLAGGRKSGGRPFGPSQGRGSVRISQA
jgi:MFS transporter, PHS family, inorganic phosphate transporter